MAELSNQYLEEVVKACRPYSSGGSVVDYIPGLDQSHSTDLGVTIVTMDGEVYGAGEKTNAFPLQSVSKIITLMLALEDFGKETVFQKVDMEPTDDAFNAIRNLEEDEKQLPHNPMINSGAIAVASLIKGNDVEEKFGRLLDFVYKITCNDQIEMDEEVYQAEQKNGARNRALAYFMESLGIISTDELEDALDLYFRLNSIKTNSLDLAKIGCFLANHGKSIEDDSYVIDPSHVRTVKAIMLTSGMYNESGTYAVEVGFPAKSGVAGTIVGTVPGKMGIGIYGPAINKKGNSVAGGRVLRTLSRELCLNLFHG
ncbi:glutaminase A [Thalassobacillus hwangdonensis]|uniref:Glutaminase n=1 Tax=Thalassobacillus hwangdonensis TaxID=546108 RepID=A0ABW3L7R3_9BACI